MFRLALFVALAATFFASASAAFPFRQGRCKGSTLRAVKFGSTQQTRPTLSTVLAVSAASAVSSVSKTTLTVSKATSSKVTSTVPEASKATTLTTSKTPVSASTSTTLSKTAVSTSTVPTSTVSKTTSSSAAPTASTASAAVSDTDGATNGLDAHNTARANYGADALTWDDTIAAGAQEYANTCALQHSGVSGLGENLAWGTSDTNGAVKLWVDEVSSYDYDNPGFTESTGHFTQVVWKSTTKVGCGFNPSCDNVYGTMTVCRYSPPGNYVNDGEFEANVGRPVS